MHGPNSGGRYDPDNPTGGGNFKPDMEIDLTNVSVAPAYTGPPIPDLSGLRGGAHDQVVSAIRQVAR